MSTFFERNAARLKDFARVSQSVGARADYVQGGGGNTSVKLADGLMAIKASGYCLKDIREDKAYAVLDYAKLRAFYNENEPAAFEDVEKAGSGKAKEYTLTIEGLDALRPSVEAGFHSLLDTYVAHSHSVYANLAACSKECLDIVSKALADADYTWGFVPHSHIVYAYLAAFSQVCLSILGKELADAGYTWGFVPYTDPGARLTFSIRDELARVEKETGLRPAVIFMENHGLIAHHDDPDECLRIHTDVNARIAAAFGVAPDSFPPVSVREIEGGLVEADAPYLTEQLATGDFTEKFFLESPLYPDQLVFLTGAFRIADALPEEGCCAVNPKTGRVLFNMPAGKAQVIAETLTAVVFICRQIEKTGRTLSTMGEAAKAFIANWESEKYRKSLAGK